MMYLVVLVALLLAYSCMQARFYLQRRRLLQQSWQTLLERIKPVNISGITMVAENFLLPSRAQLRLEPSEMWESVGGAEGLAAMRVNAEAMLALAIYAAQWNRVEGRIVGEMMRRDAVRLRRAATKIEMALFFQFGAQFAPFQLQEAIAAYHLMRCRLLSLYEIAHIGLHPHLAEVV